MGHNWISFALPHMEMLLRPCSYDLHASASASASSSSSSSDNNVGAFAYSYQYVLPPAHAPSELKVEVLLGGGVRGAPRSEILTADGQDGSSAVVEGAGELAAPVGPEKAMAPAAAGQRTSVYRGVTRREGQKRKGRQEEAAEAYDVAAIKFRGPNAVTNFELSRYDMDAIANTDLPIGAPAKRIKQTPQANDDQLPFDRSGNGQQHLSSVPPPLLHNLVHLHCPPGFSPGLTCCNLEENDPLLLTIGFDRNRRRLRMAQVAKLWMRLIAGRGGGAAAVPPSLLHRLSAVRSYHPAVYEGGGGAHSEAGGRDRGLAEASRYANTSPQETRHPLQTCKCLFISSYSLSSLLL
ncbi:hypothetical protein B296_00001281 [Ensete ventricosum]|uniref:AP2/ERF domain-containing protein n=1 Tax=Ensete ventricosum TaxID=4639 RepID=A0A427B7J2_ENSVE|nr:hypothetical protein B296_00001281 [Ensete ventricosum]